MSRIDQTGSHVTWYSDIWPMYSLHESDGSNLLLWTLCIGAFLLWMLGLAFHIGGIFVHLLVIAALIFLTLNFVRGRSDH